MNEAVFVVGSGRGIRYANPAAEEMFGKLMSVPDELMPNYLRLLTPPFNSLVQGVWSDNGGVHLNSGIWNSALWTVSPSKGKRPVSMR